MKNTKEDEIVVYRQFDNLINANIAKTKLDAYGVPCFLTEENMANLIPGGSLFAIRIRLHLFAADREKAAQILSGGALSIDQEHRVCPGCQSPRVTRAFPKKISDSVAIVFFGIFLPHKKVDQCLDCGLEF